jgi:hypothetical protein
MLWQVAAAAVIGSLFYVGRVFRWIRDHLGFCSARATGFLFASLFALIASPVTVTLFGGHPIPRFTDLFLIGIVLTAFMFTWDASVYLLAVSLAVSAWILPPYGSFTIVGFSEWYRLISFASVSLLLICMITRLKRRQPQDGVPAEARHLKLSGAVAQART